MGEAPLRDYCPGTGYGYMERAISQDEIDALWNSMFQGDGGEGGQWTEVRQYDFREGSQLSQHALEALREVVEKLSRSIEQNLRGYLRCAVRCALTLIEEGRYRDFLAGIPDRTVIGEIASPPLQGNILWEVNFNVAFAIVERMMGWQGPTSPPDRDPTPPELSLIRGVMERLSGWLEAAAEETLGIKASLKQLQIPPAHVNNMPESDPVVLAVMELGLGEVSGSSTICIPINMLLPIREQLQRAQATALQLKRQDGTMRAQVRAALERVRVLVRAELGSGEIMLGELMQLKEGDVVELSKEVGEYADVVVGDRTCFRGMPGYRGKRVAVEIREVLVPLHAKTS